MDDPVYDLDNKNAAVYVIIKSKLEESPQMGPSHGHYSALWFEF